MNYDDLLKVVREYFNDKSRSQGETKSDLMALAGECEMLADTLETDNDG